MTALAIACTSAGAYGIIDYGIIDRIACVGKGLFARRALSKGFVVYYFGRYFPNGVAVASAFPENNQQYVPRATCHALRACAVFLMGERVVQRATLFSFAVLHCWIHCTVDLTSVVRSCPVVLVLYRAWAGM